MTAEPKGRYTEGEVNIHYKSPIRREEKEVIPEEELRKRQVCMIRYHVNKFRTSIKSYIVRNIEPAKVTRLRIFIQ